MNWLRRMMYGRNGADQLSWAIMLLGLFLSGISSLGRWLYLLRYPALALYIWALARMFSRNIDARRRENLAFLQFAQSVAAKSRGFRQHLRDRKFYRYYTCPRCRQKLRVPKGKGRIEIRCPKCGETFQKKT